MKNVKLKYGYWGSKEFIAALQAQKTSTKLFKEKLLTISDCEDLILLNSGRSAIRVALKSFKQIRPHKENIIVPSYTCNAVVDAIVDEGLNPLFIDVDENLNLSFEVIEKLDLTNVLAIIIEHANGIPSDIKRISNITQSNEIFLIDDAAQIQGASINGKPPGSLGDVGIYSFAQSKTLVGGISGSGGALLINNPILVDPCQQLTASLSVSDNGRIAALKFATTYLLEKYTYLISYYYRRIFPKTKFAKMEISLINPVNSAMLLAQFSRLKYILEGKREAVLLYMKLKSNYPNIHFVQDIKNKDIIKLLIKLPIGLTPDQVKISMKQEGIQTRLAYDLPWATNNPNCKNALKIASHMIEVPIVIGMEESDVKYILDKFQMIISENDTPISI